MVRADLRDRITGRELTVLNTHLDHESETARQRAAHLLTDLVANNSRPTILTGDFNAAARASRAYSTLVTDGPMRDSWDSARERLTPAWGTFTDYLPPIADGERIDWILTTPDLTALQAAIVTAGTDVRAHSDHAAVQALLASGFHGGVVPTGGRHGERCS